MRDYIRRVLLVAIIALCVGLLFLGGRHTEAKAPEPNELQNEWIWPTGGVISDTYGTRNGDHKGIDIAGDLNSSILAVDEGIVEKSYYSDTYGHVVFIKHYNNFVTV
jgi:murein DD-endopeptidase MepM/ murein hydrolase activator NlpD